MDTNALRGAIVAKGMTQKEVAEHLGIAPKTLTLKLKRGVFGTDEARKLTVLLDIKNPSQIFFGN
ncbi:MAG: hypothetical protein E6672_05585 [Negativicoccus succinicivorans]|nr:hypothetical protein [Negativicoccus succinicivorans]MDU3350720.1 DUF739 domain-containing protein [Clostridium sp.]